ncbi:MAG: cell division protein FtsA [Omnitrophica WOR_2 bacterium RIFCSPHIGHO2_02_FULL_52_10]|nr:MAG: cell division protein FtsA [Omnitrophica WOR_2 bacterium RIFCSPHIGHO2_02_FULL_52_10]
MLGKMINDKYYCGLDIGERSVKAGILKIKDAADPRLVGVYEHKTYGFKDNAVSNLEEFSDCIHRTVEELTKNTGVKVKEVYVGLGGALIESRSSATVIPLIDRGNKVITRRDIKKVNDNARLLGMHMEEEILHDLPQYYRIDDAHTALNPLGLYGRKLGVHSLMIVVNGNSIRNITQAVHQAGYNVADVFFDSYAASQVVLSDEERKTGCILADIGARNTTVLVFRDGVLQYSECLPAGGGSLTQHIAEKLGLPFELAEEIKRSYAVASDQDRHRDEEILVKKEEAYIPIKRGMIYDAIRPDIEQLTEGVRAAIVRSQLRDQIKGGMTLLGGGSLLPGLIERLDQELQIPVQLGQMKLPLRKNLSYTATFASVVGLAQSGYKTSFHYTISPNGHQSWTRQFSNRVRDLYEEYF